MRCARGNKTISGLALSVISAIPPLDLFIEMKLEVKNGRDKAEAYDDMEQK